MVLELARAALPTPDEKLLGAARLIWSCTFGAPRIGRPGKLRRQATAHLRQLPLHDGPTAAAWLRRRRQEAAAAAAAATVTPATTPITDQALEAAAIAAWRFYLMQRCHTALNDRCAPNSPKIPVFTCYVVDKCTDVMRILNLTFDDFDGLNLN